MGTAVSKRKSRVRVVETFETGGAVEAASVAVRLVRGWLAGWQAYARVAGGRAQDLVGASPWHQFRESADAAD